eukprot:TRINITY_DN8003_c0_g1_i1.p1 TRINITY_DN8003_c0_g1~~TRINITY_DN8003_c0_g1_i1.p1  ORF type:complete len:559 (+),score=123.05 TRINITY_DN8003_c0_g1_i1:306-1982(+)
MNHTATSSSFINLLLNPASEDEAPPRIMLPSPHPTIPQFTQQHILSNPYTNRVPPMADSHPLLTVQPSEQLSESTHSLSPTQYTKPLSDPYRHNQHQHQHQHQHKPQPQQQEHRFSVEPQYRADQSQGYRYHQMHDYAHSQQRNASTQREHQPHPPPIPFNQPTGHSSQAQMEVIPSTSIGSIRIIAGPTAALITARQVIEPPLCIAVQLAPDIQHRMDPRITQISSAPFHSQSPSYLRNHSSHHRHHRHNSPGLDSQHTHHPHPYLSTMGSPSLVSTPQSMTHELNDAHDWSVSIRIVDGDGHEWAPDDSVGFEHQKPLRRLTMPILRITQESLQKSQHQQGKDKEQQKEQQINKQSPPNQPASNDIPNTSMAFSERLNGDTPMQQETLLELRRMRINTSRDHRYVRFHVAVYYRSLFVASTMTPIYRVCAHSQHRKRILARADQERMNAAMAKRPLLDDGPTVLMPTAELLQKETSTSPSESPDENEAVTTKLKFNPPASPPSISDATLVMSALISAANSNSSPPKQSAKEISASVIPPFPVLKSETVDHLPHPIH